MVSRTNLALFAALALATASAAGQQPQSGPASPPPAPKLSTADTLALTACEKAKKEARDQFDISQRQETAVISEWNDAHPGFYVDQQTFVVTPQKTPEKPASAGKTEEPKAAPKAEKK